MKNEKNFLQEANEIRQELALRFLSDWALVDAKADDEYFKSPAFAYETVGSLAAMEEFLQISCTREEILMLCAAGPEWIGAEADKSTPMYFCHQGSWLGKSWSGHRLIWEIAKTSLVAAIYDIVKSRTT